MSILIVAFGATILGFLLILLAGSGKPVSPAAIANASSGGATDLDWARGYGVEGLERMLRTLFGEMGFTPERSVRGQGTVDFYAVDPTPIRRRPTSAS